MKHLKGILRNKVNPLISAPKNSIPWENDNYVRFKILKEIL